MYIHAWMHVEMTTIENRASFGVQKKWWTWVPHSRFWSKIRWTWSPIYNLINSYYSIIIRYIETIHNYAIYTTYIYIYCIYIHVVQHNEVWLERISGRKKIDLLAEKDWSLQSSRHGIISSSNFPALTCNGTSWIPISAMPKFIG